MLMLSFTIKSTMLNVIMLNVVILNIVAPFIEFVSAECDYSDCTELSITISNILHDGTQHNDT
jgi:hypothetical protein